MYFYSKAACEIPIFFPVGCVVRLGPIYEGHMYMHVLYI